MPKKKAGGNRGPADKTHKKGAKDPIRYERQLEKEISHRQAKLAEIRSAKKTPGKRQAAPRVRVTTVDAADCPEHRAANFTQAK
mmetsp:Transcript_59634/g.132792  ORF Transcript_59634/g.132792 Transcript_59634/m.132792 type:complete len:84 (+) Transcript_59634:166-417(+)